MSRILDEGFEGSGYEDPNWLAVKDGSNIVNEDYSLSGTKPYGSESQGLDCIAVTGDAKAYAYNLLAWSSWDIYVRAYIKCKSTNFNDGEGCTIIRANYLTNSIADIQIMQVVGGAKKWRFRYYDNGSMVVFSVGVQSFSLNTWYRFEFLYDITNKIWEVRLDGNTIDSGNIGTPYATEPDRLGVGVMGCTGTNADSGSNCEVVVDLVAVDDANWIGLVNPTFTDGVAIADSTSKAVGKSLSDGVAIADLPGNAIGKPFSDEVRTTDSVGKAIGKNLSDGIVISDSYSKVWMIYRTFTDGVKIADSIAKSMVKLFTDGINLADSTAKSLSKIFSDQVSVSESSITAAKQHVEPSGIWSGVVKLYDLILGWGFSHISEKITSWTQTSEKTDAFTKIDEKSTSWTERSEETDPWSKV